MEGLAKLSADSDAELVKRVRAGDLAAYEQIYARHRQAALRLARSMVDAATAEDVVADAFLGLLKRFQAGGGPNFAVRPYLLQIVRFGAIDARRRRREDPVDPGADGWHRSPLDRDVPDVQEQLAENSLAQQALLSLPARQRAVLWLGEVEGLDRHQIGEWLGVSAGAVSALALRARESLKRAYLVMHLESTSSPECTECLELLPAVVRGTASRTEAWAVAEHLATCNSCRRVQDELAGINSNLSGFLTPAMVGLMAADSVKTVAPGAWSSAAVAGGGPSSASAFAVASAAASVALITSVAVVLGVLATPETVRSQAQTRLALPSAVAAPATPRLPRPKRAPAHSEAPQLVTFVQPVSNPVRETPSPSVTAPPPSPLPAPSPQPTPATLPLPVPEPAPLSGAPATVPTQGEDLKVSVASAKFLHGLERVGVHLSVDLDLGRLESAVVEIEVAGLSAFAVHSDDQFGAWVCSEQAPGDANRAFLRCVLSPGGTTTSLGIDLTFSGQPAGSIAVSAPDNDDPDLSNNFVAWAATGADEVDQSTHGLPTQ